MEFSEIFAITQAGMDYEKARLKAASLNIANANTIQTSANGAYKPITATANSPFSTEMLKAGEATNNINLQTQNIEPRRVYQPSHPAADSSGFIYYSNVNLVEEMSTLTSSKRAYEANIKILNAINSMSQKALEIGK